MNRSIKKLDFMILEFIQDTMRSKRMDRLMSLITELGDKGILWLSEAAVLMMIKKYRRSAAAILTGLVSGLIAGNLAIKNLVRRSRPCWTDPISDMLVSIPKDYSFPSCHTMSSFMAARVMMHYDKRIGIPSGIIASLIAFSRMYLYVHFPSDILGGAMLGNILGKTAIKLTKKR